MTTPLRTQVLPSAQGVAASATAQIVLPLGVDYHLLALDFANAVTTIDRIRVKVNGATIQEATGAEMDAINQFYGQAAASSNSNSLMIWFDQPGLRSRAGREFTALKTGQVEDRQVRSAVVEIDFDGTAGPGVSGVAVVSPPSVRSEAVRKITRTTFQPSATGTFEATDIPTADAISGIHLRKATEAPTNVAIKGDGFTFFDRTATLNSAILGSCDHVRTPQTNYYHVDPQEFGDGLEVYTPAAASDFRLQIDITTAEAITALMERPGPIPV